MTEKEIVDWYRDLRQISWIFPELNRPGRAERSEESSDQTETTGSGIRR